MVRPDSLFVTVLVASSDLVEVADRVAAALAVLLPLAVPAVGVALGVGGAL
jgi:hypothetical protein